MVSLSATDKNNKMGEGGGRLIPLNAAKDIIEKLATRKDFYGEINPSWQFCESDNVCVQSKNQCGKPIGVNKKYQNQNLDFLKLKLIKTDCTKLAEDKKIKPNQSKCMENFCS
jgi:hypothetical protein